VLGQTPLLAEKDNIYMRKVALLLIAILAVAAVASAADMMVNWKHQDVKFTSDVRVGTQVLPAGDYRVQHVMEGSNHILVFKQQNNGSQTFRLGCTMQQLNAKATQTEQHFRYDGNEKVLVALVFRGDTYQHTF
jgi:hypothetical protein